MNKERELIAKDVVDASIRIHKDLGPGLLESVYTVILKHKLIVRGHEVESEIPISMNYGGIQFDLGFRADLRINHCFIVEVKSIEKLATVHPKQLLTYLKITGYHLGMLINFGEAYLKNGIKRIAN